MRVVQPNREKGSEGGRGKGRRKGEDNEKGKEERVKVILPPFQYFSLFDIFTVF